MVISDEAAMIFFIMWMCLGTPLIGLAMFTWVQRRTQALKKYATAAGYEFSHSDYHGIADTIEKLPFQLTQHKRHSRVSKVFEVPYQYGQILIFEYTIGSGRGARTYRVAMIESADIPNIDFHIKQERLKQRIAPAIGFNDKDIDFEQYPVFSKRYFLQGSDEHGIKDLFNPQLIQWFEEIPTKYTVEAVNGRLLIYDQNEFDGRGINEKVVDRLKHDGVQLHSIISQY